MSPLLILYCINATLLLIHEIESSYEKEWEILALPGGITGFLLLHIPSSYLFSMEQSNLHGTHCLDILFR